MAGSARKLSGTLRELHPDVHALGVLAEDHQVDVLAVIERVAAATRGRGAGRCRDPASAACARSGCDSVRPRALQFGRQFALGLAGGLGGDGAEEGAIGAAQQVERARRQGVAFPPPELPPDIAGQVVGLESGGIQHQAGGGAHLRADSVARQPRNPVFSTFPPAASRPRISASDMGSARRPPAARPRAGRAAAAEKLRSWRQVANLARHQVDFQFVARRGTAGRLGETIAGRPRLMALR